MNSNTVTIVTHDGKFHPDDVFAVASLQLLLGNKPSEIIRTREEKWFSSGDYVVDVGGEYEPEKNKFDHHQREGAGKRDNGIPYASFGLVWKKYGEEICSKQEVAKRIDEKLIQLIDAGDNGIDTISPLFSEVFPYTVGNIVELFRPTWKEENNYDDQFLKAVSWAREILKREITKTTDWIEAENKVKKMYERTDNKEMIIFEDKNESYGREIVGKTLLKYPEPIYTISYRDESKKWQVLAIRKDEATFDLRKPLPEAWRGLAGKELASITGVSDAIFCHSSGFMCVTETKEGAIKLVNLALK